MLLFIMQFEYVCIPISTLTYSGFGSFHTKEALSVWTNLDKHLQVICLCVSSIKTGRRRVIRLGEPSCEIRLERSTMRDNLSKRIICSCAHLYTKDA